ncbi:MAG: pantoate--beta-alanine ligase [Ignavibacteriales bacterium]|nr:pantoate--beta-alanine ligase [Ignavibacteriales bacterium]
MKIINTIKEMHSFSKKTKREGKTLALVPTMGFLHEGHLSLVRKAKEIADIVVVSLFVNPTQFAPNEDFTKYPRDEERDKKLLEDLDVDVLFIPSEQEIYPKEFQTYVDVWEITKKQEGEFRPAHFKGVTTVVSILFNCVYPDYAIFGQKDAQQVAVVKQMVRDLKFDIQIVVSPIVREFDGLAMSSRNVYLSVEERKDALVLYESLKYAISKVKEGERNIREIVSQMIKKINSVKTSNLEYIRIVLSSNFSESEILIEGNEYYVLIACRIGATRLIDNVLVNV